MCPSDPDNDRELDGVCGDVDNCPGDPNADQADLDADGEGNACDTDDDDDGSADDVDNCPLAYNPDQADGDQDGAGDACDEDLDDDDVLDSEDDCPGSAGGDATDAAGCSIEQLCPCDGDLGGVPWKNHGAYIQCVSGEAARFVTEGAIPGTDWSGLVAAAGKATCR